jgi:hypothetical protein
MTIGSLRAPLFMEGLDLSGDELGVIPDPADQR